MTLRATGSPSSTASARRGRRRSSGAASAPRRSTSGWRRCLCADLLVAGAGLPVRDSDRGDASAREGERGDENHPGAEAVRRGVAKLGAALVLAERNCAFRLDLAVEDEGDDE